MAFKRKEDWQAELVAAVFASNALLDTSPGSPMRRGIIDPVSESLEEASFLIDSIEEARNFDILVGENLDDFVANFGFSRLPAQKATVRVKIYTPNEELQKADRDYTFLSGTTVRSDKGLAFVLDDTVVLPKGEWFVYVNATSQIGGVSYNVAAGAITFMESYGGFLVTNEEPAIGGADPENDESLKNRFKATKFRSVTGTRSQNLAVPREVESGVTRVASFSNVESREVVTSFKAYALGRQTRVINGTEIEGQVLDASEFDNEGMVYIVEDDSVEFDEQLGGGYIEDVDTGSLISPKRLVAAVLDDEDVIFSSERVRDFEDINLFAYYQDYDLKLPPHSVLVDSLVRGKAYLTPKPAGRLGLKKTNGISAINRVNNVITVTTKYNHLLSLADQVVASGVSPSTFNGVYKIKTIVDSNNFMLDGTGANGSGSGGSIALNKENLVRVSYDYRPSVSRGSGAVDIYVDYEYEQNTTDTFVKAFGVTKFYLHSRPVRELLSVKVAGVDVDIVDSSGSSGCMLIKDTSAKRESNKSSDYIEFFNYSVSLGQYVVVEYVYNSVPDRIQGVIDQVRAQTDDVLVHSGRKGLLTIKANVVVSDGYLLEDAVAGVKEFFTNFISNIDFGGQAVSISDLLNEAYNSGSVDSMKITAMVLEIDDEERSYTRDINLDDFYGEDVYLVFNDLMLTQVDRL